MLLRIRDRFLSQGTMHVCEFFYCVDFYFRLSNQLTYFHESGNNFIRLMATRNKCPIFSTLNENMLLVSFYNGRDTRYVIKSTNIIYISSKIYIALAKEFLFVDIEKNKMEVRRKFNCC